MKAPIPPSGSVVAGPHVTHVKLQASFLATYSATCFPMLPLSGTETHILMEDNLFLTNEVGLGVV